MRLIYSAGFERVRGRRPLLEKGPRSRWGLFLGKRHRKLARGKLALTIAILPAEDAEPLTGVRRQECLGVRDS